MNPRKEMFEAKQRYVENKAAENLKIGTRNGLTEEQCYALDNMCKARHEMHCNQENIFVSEEGYKYLRQVQKAHLEMLSVGLPPIPTLPKYAEDYIDIDSLYELIEMGEAPSDVESQEYKEWFEEEFERCINDVHQVNERIETYLREEIDKKYGTHYAPSGFARLK